MIDVLSESSSRIRDWGLFLLAAALPALAVGLIGLRALRNEEAALRRELSLLAEATALAEQRRFEAALDELLAGDEASVPPWAEPVHIAADTLDPARPAEAPEAATPKPCREHAEQLARAEASAWQQAAEGILTGCAEARTDRGRWLWPLTALDARVAIDAERLRDWLERHRGRLDPVERASIRREIGEASWWDAATKASLDDVLAGGSALRAQALSAPHRYAMQTDQSPVRWRDGQSAGRLERQPDGSYTGFVVHAGSLLSAMNAGWPSLPDSLRARLVRGGSDPAGAASLPVSHDVPLLEGLRLVVGHPHPERVARRSKLVLGGAAAALGAIAIALAALLFSRMRRARQLSALRTDFVAAVSHELRTPIASLRMLAELLATDRVQDDERDDVHQALAQEAKRLGLTVDRLLGFSRMEAGKLRLEREPTDLCALAEEAIATFEARHPEAAPVTRRFDEDRSPIAIDPQALRMVIDNLLGNARKYAPGGTPYEVTIEREPGGVRLSVRDRGPGIAKRHQRRIFRPFERADDRLSEATEGSGIGLSLVRHVAHSHDGSVSVDSMPGEGATFIVWLPAAPEKGHRNHEGSTRA